MKHIISLGEVLIDLIPGSRVQLAETCYTPYPGGAIANVSVAIARLGGSSRFIGGVSDDERVPRLHLVGSSRGIPVG